ncbi:unnamed protein product, partial [Mesorhabditis spiculigera]
MGDKSAYKTNLLNKASISYDYLHTNSTTHEFVFGAIAELVDNSYDAAANSLRIDWDPNIQGLSFLDDGCGMTREEAISVISFGHSFKKANPNTVGQYGNGLKSGSMRVGKDLIVFTKKNQMRTCLFLSRTFHEENRLKEVFVPTPSFSEGDNAYLENPEEDKERHGIEMDIIFKYSPFKDAASLFGQFEKISGSSGTLIVLYNLRQLDMIVPELDFTSEKYDIRLSQNSDQREAERNSLRSYLSVLYAKPRMKVYLRGMKVAQTNLVYSLSHRRKYLFAAKNLKNCAKRAHEQAQAMVRSLEDQIKEAQSDLSRFMQSSISTMNRDTKLRVNLLDLKVAELSSELKQAKEREQTAQKAKANPVPITFYFGLNLHCRNRYGIMVYNNGRLIEMYAKPTILRERHDQNMKCLGVIGIVDVPCTVLAPTHNKQGFENRTEYLCLMRAANEHMEQYWMDLKLAEEKGGIIQFWKALGYNSTAWESVCDPDTRYKLERQKLIGCYTVQCDKCLKWRHLDVQRRYIDQGIPEGWTCQDNPNSACQSCAKEEQLQSIKEGKMSHGKEREKDRDVEVVSAPERLQKKEVAAPIQNKQTAKITPLRAPVAAAVSQPPIRAASARAAAATQKRALVQSEEDEDEEEVMPKAKSRRSVASSRSSPISAAPPSIKSSPSTRRSQASSRKVQSSEEEEEEGEEPEESEESEEEIEEPLPPRRSTARTAQPPPPAREAKRRETIEPPAKKQAEAPAAEAPSAGDHALAVAALRTVLGALANHTQDAMPGRMKSAPEKNLYKVDYKDLIDRVLAEAKKQCQINANLKRQKEKDEEAKELANWNHPAFAPIKKCAFDVISWGAQGDPDFEGLTLDNSLEKLQAFAETVHQPNEPSSTQ